MSLEEIFGRAGCRGFLHAMALDGDGEVGLDADEDVVPASVIKVLVALEAETRLTDGRLDPDARVRLSAERRTPGPTGFSLFRDDVEVSVRDLPVLMLTVSDNVCTDALLDRVGLDAVNATATRLGLTGVTRNRLGLGFGPGTGVAAKSGALMGVVRNEVGVVTLPDGQQYAVAAFTRTHDPGADERAVNAAIGEAAARAVAELSPRRRTP